MIRSAMIQVETIRIPFCQKSFSKLSQCLIRLINMYCKTTRQILSKIHWFIERY